MPYSVILLKTAAISIYPICASLLADLSLSMQRLRALALYKELHRLGRDYDASYDFHGKLRKLYEKNRSLTDEGEIERALAFGEYIKNETLALYSLRKYRHLKRMYPPASTSNP